jgi:hypothetical protein
MTDSPVSPQLNRQLDQLTRDIRSGLAQVRRHLRELEQVERTSLDPATARPRFAALLGEAMAAPSDTPARPAKPTE